MPELFTMPDTCALAPNIAVAWLGAPVTIRNMAHGDHQKPGFLVVNPQGKVPALRFEDGDVLTEVAAILAWLGATHGNGALGARHAPRAQGGRGVVVYDLGGPRVRLSGPARSVVRGARDVAYEG